MILVLFSQFVSQNNVEMETGKLIKEAIYSVRRSFQEKHAD